MTDIVRMCDDIDARVTIGLEKKALFQRDADLQVVGNTNLKLQCNSALQLAHTRKCLANLEAKIVKRDKEINEKLERIETITRKTFGFVSPILHSDFVSIIVC
jgi:uncharacterized protein (DUF3084 family)